MGIKSYKDLIVWQKSFVLTEHIYLITKKFPREEQFGLTAQMRRCAVSVVSNIAEGFCRGTSKDRQHFLRVSLGSAAELETQLLLANALQYVDNKQSLIEQELLSEVQKMLNTAIKRLTII